MPRARTWVMALWKRWMLWRDGRDEQTWSREVRTPPLSRKFCQWLTLVLGNYAERQSGELKAKSSVHSYPRRRGRRQHPRMGTRTFKPKSSRPPTPGHHDVGPRNPATMSSTKPQTGNSGSYLQRRIVLTLYRAQRRG
ncbi:hypothetical protein EXIGLDRAFT_726287 [Exidia glandulosa HHB12029]|uniref:Uncharacterized protein n=1 Tax=Exidia glandulosa HHB12029 TaxID=1314781 RepID=A0A165ZRV9_EXIGL|nr:hypothetical protein EXIGLDRAFT_726287 [Exidia glandulosa HHB12029]